METDDERIFPRLDVSGDEDVGGDVLIVYLLVRGIVNFKGCEFLLRQGDCCWVDGHVYCLAIESSFGRGGDLALAFV